MEINQKQRLSSFFDVKKQPLCYYAVTILTNDTYKIELRRHIIRLIEDEFKPFLTGTHQEQVFTAQAIQQKLKCQHEKQYLKRHRELTALFAQLNMIEKPKLNMIEKPKSMFNDYQYFEHYKIRQYSRLDTLLSKLSKKQLISEVDFSWLVVNRFVTPTVHRTYYFILANNHYKAWEKTHRGWDFVNAVSCYRKAKNCLSIIEDIDNLKPFLNIKNKKLRSATLTTCGGVYRDIEQLDEAIKLGELAHNLTPDNYRPCTLLGACWIISGNTSLGLKYYQKAMALGFKEEDYYSDLEYIKKTASKLLKKEIDRLLRDKYQ